MIKLTKITISEVVKKVIQPGCVFKADVDKEFKDYKELKKYKLRLHRAATWFYKKEIAISCTYSENINYLWSGKTK